MCGICGELRFDGEPPDLAGLGRMVKCLARRGPDHEGSYSTAQLAMGHRRLAIIDLSGDGDQPMVDSKSGLVIVFNGTIYNYPELRDELRASGHQFTSNSDTEVILKAYAAWGEQCVERLVGMFACAIWDLRNRRLFLARDRLGIKPLYYSRDGNRLLFASSVQALLAAGGVDTAIDRVALHYQLTLHGVVPAPRTILQGVRKLPPAHTLSVTPDGKSELRRYWWLYACRPQGSRREGEWVEAIHGALRRAVRRRLEIADVPVGVLLSGGLDSSLLVGLLAEHGVEDLLTFSIGFEDQPEERGDEFVYSDQVAELYRTRHHKYHIANAMVFERLPDAVVQMAEPMVSQDAVAFYLLAERVAEEVKVVQSGQGADEVFAGYFWYPQMVAERGSDLERFARHYFDRPHSEFMRAVSADYLGEDYTAAMVAGLLAEPGGDEYLDKVLRMDVTTLVVDDPVKRVDNMTMAWGLEARVPFLDHELVELAMAMPSALKLGANGNEHKYVLKRIARSLLPNEVIDRPKGYFPLPTLKYLRGDALEFVHSILNSDACRSRGIFNRDYLQELLAAPDHEAVFTRLRGSKLWHMALLELWLQRNVDGVGG